MLALLAICFSKLPAVPSYKYDPLPVRHDVGRPVTFINKSPDGLDLYFDDGGAGLYQGTIQASESTGTTSYLGHSFFFTKQGSKIRLNTMNIVVSKFEYAYVANADTAAETERLEEEKWKAEYLKASNRNWIAQWPKPPPRHHMWAADYVGQNYEITTASGRYSCIPASSSDGCAPQTEKYTLSVVKTAPQIFEIEDFISAAEADYIIERAKPEVTRSTAMGQVMDVRTSSTTWLGWRRYQQEDDAVMKTIFRRAADLLKIPQVLDPGVSEDMQVVRYTETQEYRPHYDWWVQKKYNSRFCTLLLYLNTPEEGGETSFPYADLEVTPQKGKAVLFYNLLPDGNADAMSLHGALPVVKGEKWLANFWVWDPAQPGSKSDLALHEHQDL